MTRGVFILLLVVCVAATITEGYGSYRHGGYPGHTGLYKTHLNSYKDLLTGYGNDYAAGHIQHSGHFHKIVVGRLYRRFHQLGIDLIGNGLRYKNYYYARKCEPLKLYNAFSACFNEYGSIGDCFPGLIKTGLIGHRHAFQKYGRSFGLGVKFVRRGIIYHETVYHYHVRSLEFIWTMTSCYNAFHHASICVPKLQKQGLIGAPHPLTGYVGGTTGYHGFKIVNGRFSYHGHAYKLSCSRTHFYSVWNKCYTQYHSVSRCFGYLQQQHLFVSYSSSSIVGYHGYDQLGFKIVNGGFSYHGKAYTLKCSESRFYRLWDDCYGHYHKGSVCFDRLFKQGLFGYHSDYANDDFDYLGYYNSHHGFHLVNGGFTYKHVAYKLSCNTERFYRSWHNCYDSYHSVDVCFGRLYKNHLFVSLDHGDTYPAHTNYHGYKYLGFKLNQRRFSYHGKAYRLKCSTRRFYKLWDDCYFHYHSRNLCFNKIYKQHFFDYYHDTSSIVHGGDYIDDFGYYKAHHGFNIVNGGFSYNGAAYKLSCSRTRFYRAWRSCYGTYHSVDVCYGRLLNDHLFVALDGGHGYHSNYHGYKFLGFKIRHRRFSYLGKAYRLKCNRRRFYRVWDNCYNHYHDRSVCFDKLFKRHIFDYYGDYGHAHIGASYHGDYGYYKAHHGFSIVGGNFLYKGAGFKLSCSKARFYKAWNYCYRSYHNVDQCFGRLYNQHLFIKSGPDYDYSYLKKNLYLHQKIAAHHVQRIHNVANSHVGRINLVAKTHARHIHDVANKHVNRLSSEANSHIKRFLKIANNHLYRLQKHSKSHLESLEEQHKRHLMEREHQHKTHVINKEIINTKHEHAINAAHHYAYAKGGVYAPAGTVIKTVSHGSYGYYK
uniref:YGH-rich protein-1 n=1 Tax=Mytilus coruscus TaxID=42192 RepID=A0A0K2D7W0_MYTCO|nr:YGH-rich protein-1 [Mytilus coruscus]